MRKRLDRARALRKLWPSADEVLQFFEHVALFELQPPLVASKLFDLVERVGPPALAYRAVELRVAGAGGGTPVFENSVADRFFAKILREGPCPGHVPAVAVLRDDPESQAVVRTLVCAWCSAEWSFPRILCPACREERPEKLPHYAAEDDIPWVRVDACDTCRRYIKCVDITRCPDAEPVVDELASAPLDVLARERGYVKIEPNFAGI